MMARKAPKRPRTYAVWIGVSWDTDYEAPAVVVRDPDQTEHAYVLTPQIAADLLRSLAGWVGRHLVAQMTHDRTDETHAANPHLYEDLVDADD